MTVTSHAEQIALLADHYRPYGWSEASVVGYLVAVGDLDVDLVRRAVVDVIRTVDKMPSGAELRRAALALATGVGPPDPDTAWAEVLTRAGTHGRLRTPDWSHPLIGRAVASVGGWGRLCASDDLTGMRIAFVRAYQAHAERTERAALTSPGFAAAAELVARAAALPAATEGRAPR